MTHKWVLVVLSLCAACGVAEVDPQVERTATLESALACTPATCPAGHQWSTGQGYSYFSQADCTGDELSDYDPAHWQIGQTWDGTGCVEVSVHYEFTAPSRKFYYAGYDQPFCDTLPNNRTPAVPWATKLRYVTHDCNPPPVLDGDNDGVPDSLDTCAGTPSGCGVDASGCMLDSDFDGVCDSRDTCPGTPVNVGITAAGCPNGEICYNYSITNSQLVYYDDNNNGVYDEGCFACTERYCMWRGGGPITFSSQPPACSEASCVAPQAAYLSHFTGPGCTGTESYYTPYDSGLYTCRPWSTAGASCGTQLRTETNRSYKNASGQCVDAWPSGNTLSGFVRVYRPTACGEASCAAASSAYVSHFTGLNCTGTESYYTLYGGPAYECQPWSTSGAVCGTQLRTETNRSYKNASGQCVNAWPAGNTLSGFARVYR